MKVLEKHDKANRVMVSVFPIEGAKRGKGSKSFTVLGTTVKEVYTILLEALKKAERA